MDWIMYSLNKAVLMCSINSFQTSQVEFLKDKSGQEYTWPPFSSWLTAPLIFVQFYLKLLVHVHYNSCTVMPIHYCFNLWIFLNISKHDHVWMDATLSYLFIRGVPWLLCFFCMLALSICIGIVVLKFYSKHVAQHNWACCWLATI